MNTTNARLDNGLRHARAQAVFFSKNNCPKRAAWWTEVALSYAREILRQRKEEQLALASLRNVFFLSGIGASHRILAR